MDELNLPKKRKIEVDAPLYARVLAFIIDLLILNSFILFPFQSVLVSMLPQENISQFLADHPVIVDQLYYILFLMAIIILLYFSLMEYKLGQTLGDMIFKIIVVSQDKKKQLTFLQCVLSNLYVFPFFPFFMLWVMDPIRLYIKKETFSNHFSKRKVVQYQEV